VSVPDKNFQTSLMFVGKDGACPSDAPFVNYVRKKFYRIGPWACSIKQIAE
jgi:hypothetical protein